MSAPLQKVTDTNCEDILTNFLLTQLHEGQEVKGKVTAPDDVCVVAHVTCDLDVDQTTRFLRKKKNLTADDHVQVLVVNRLREDFLCRKQEAPLGSRGNEGEKPKLNVQLYQNYSPCTISLTTGRLYKCAEETEIFFKEAGKIFQVDMDITFVGLHDVTRPSCLYDKVSGSNLRPCSHDPMFSLGKKPGVSELNVEWLRSLQQNGVRLRCFQDVDWNSLVDFLVIERGGERGKGRGRGQLQEILDRTRDRRTKEDSYMQSNLSRMLKGER